MLIPRRVLILCSSCNQYHFCTIHAGLWIGWNTESYSICCFCSLFMFNMEKPLPVGLFQTVQAFAVNRHNLLQSSIFSLQTTYLQFYRESCVSFFVLWCINHHPHTTKSVEWVQPLTFHSQVPFFGGYADWNLPTADLPPTSKTSDLSLKKVSMMSSAASNIHGRKPPVAQSVAQFQRLPTRKPGGWKCQRQSQNSRSKTTYAFSFLSAQGAKYHPARTPASWKKWCFFLAVSSP